MQGCWALVSDADLASLMISLCSRLSSGWARALKMSWTWLGTWPSAC